MSGARLTAAELQYEAWLKSCTVSANARGLAGETT